MDRILLALAILFAVPAAAAEDARWRGPTCTDIDMQICSAHVVGPMTMALVPLLKWAKDAGQLRDVDHCRASMREARELQGTIGSIVAEIATIGCGDCACRLAF